LDPSDAEDITQEALLRAWRHRGSLEHRDRLWGWLAQITRNEAARQRARPAPEPVAEAGSWRGVEDEALLSVPLRIDVESALATLESGERLLIGLRYGEDLTQAAIARLLEVPEGTVKVRLHRARAKLHRALGGA
jgi:RNA polymerase sigma-70 factor (ECF subfamily)